MFQNIFLCKLLIPRIFQNIIFLLKEKYHFMISIEKYLALLDERIITVETILM